MIIKQQRYYGLFTAIFVCMSFLFVHIYRPPTAQEYYLFIPVYLFGIFLLRALIELATTFPKHGLFTFFTKPYGRWIGFAVTFTVVLALFSLIHAVAAEWWMYGVLLLGFVVSRQRFQLPIVLVLLFVLLADTIIFFQLDVVNLPLSSVDFAATLLALMVLSLFTAAQYMKFVEFSDEVLPTMLGPLNWIVLASYVVIFFLFGSSLLGMYSTLATLFLAGVILLPVARASVRELMHEKCFFPWLAKLDLLLFFFLAAMSYWITFKSFIAPLGLTAYLLILGVAIVRKKYPDLEHPYKNKKIVLETVILGLVLFPLLWLTPWTVEFIGVIVGASLIYVLFDLYYTESIAVFFQGTCLRRVMDFLYLNKRLLKNVDEFIGTSKQILLYGVITGVLTKKYPSALCTHRNRHRVRQLGEKAFQDKLSAVHPAVGRVQAIISPFTFSSLARVRHVLGELNTLLPIGGKLVVIDLNWYLYLVPNKFLTKNKSIQRLFNDFGFEVKISRRVHFGAQRVVIYATKTAHATSLKTWYTEAP